MQDLGRIGEAEEFDYGWVVLYGFTASPRAPAQGHLDRTFLGCCLACIKDAHATQSSTHTPDFAFPKSECVQTAL
jgi:hypothetical protein